MSEVQALDQQTKLSVTAYESYLWTAHTIFYPETYYLAVKAFTENPADQKVLQQSWEGESPHRANHFVGRLEFVLNNAQGELGISRALPDSDETVTKMQTYLIEDVAEQAKELAKTEGYTAVDPDILEMGSPFEDIDLLKSIWKHGLDHRRAKVFNNYSIEDLLPNYWEIKTAQQ